MAPEELWQEYKDYGRLQADEDEACSPEQQKEWSGGQDKMKVKFIRVVHSDLLVLPFPEPKCSMASTILMPPFTLPKIMGLPCNHTVLAVQIENWEPFVLGPAFAMDWMPGPIGFRIKFSSPNFSLRWASCQSHSSM